MLARLRLGFVAVLVSLAACSGSPSAPTDNAIDLACTAAPVLDLAVGRDTVLDLTRNLGCVRVAVAPDREYFALPYGSSGLVLPGGVRSEALLRTGEGRQQAALAQLHAHDRASSAQSEVDLAHRRREAVAAARWAAGARSATTRDARSVTTVPPGPGDRRTFIACGDIACSTTVTVVARARVVRRSIAIYVDSLAPEGGFSDAELAEAAALFDDYLLPIDTLAFGAPSDIDGNGVVIALLTPAVNALSGQGCRNGTVLGYFDGTDLIANAPGSNRGEIFFGEVPDPNGACPVQKSRALRDLPVTFVHELQHMISFRQHVLDRGGSAESIWLNEALSHFAEELAGRAVPEVPGATTNRLTQFALTNLDNAYGFLLDPDAAALVFGSASSGSPSERGAGWLFMRWLVDHFRGQRPVESVTRPLLETSLTGAANVANATGVSFERLSGRWLMAVFLDDRPNTLAAADLQLASWDLRTTFDRLNQQDPGRFPRRFPLLPPVLGAQSLARRMIVRGGSGDLVQLNVSGASGSFTMQITDTATAALSALTEPRLLIVRTR